MTKFPEQFDGRFMRVMASVIAPGAVALLPWLAVASVYSPSFGGWMLSSPPLALGSLALALFCAGMVMENLGSRLEVSLDRRQGVSMQHWWTYLGQRQSSIIGHSYLSSLVTRLKFELGMVFALLSAALALAFLSFPLAAIQHCIGLFFIAFALGASLYFRMEAATTVRQLDKARKKLNTKLARGESTQENDTA